MLAVAVPLRILFSQLTQFSPRRIKSWRPRTKKRSHSWDTSVPNLNTWRGSLKRRLLHNPLKSLSKPNKPSSGIYFTWKRRLIESVHWGWLACIGKSLLSWVMILVESWNASLKSLLKRSNFWRLGSWWWPRLESRLKMYHWLPISIFSL